MRGRKPTPTHLKVLRGNPGKRPLPANEPQPKPKAPPCPAHLDAEAKREWRRMVKELEPLGLLTKIDRAALAAYCQAWSRWVQAEEMIRKTGMIVKAPNTGFPIQNPLLPVANRAMEQMRKFLTEFGMTPSSRARVTAAPSDGNSDPAEEFFTDTA